MGFNFKTGKIIITTYITTATAVADVDVVTETDVSDVAEEGTSVSIVGHMTYVPIMDENYVAPCRAITPNQPT